MSSATANTHFPTSGMLGVKFNRVSTTAEFDLGTMVEGTDGTTWVYVQSDAGTAAYLYVCIDENFQSVTGTTTLVDTGHMVGVPQVAFADNEYGWVPIRGTNLLGNLQISCAADIVLHTSAVAGSFDDLTSVGTRVLGVVAITGNALTSVAANVEIMIGAPAQGVTY